MTSFSMSCGFKAARCQATLPPLACRRCEAAIPSLDVQSSAHQLSHLYEPMAGRSFKGVPVMCNQDAFGASQGGNEPLYISKKAVHLVGSASLHSIAAYVLWAGFMQ